MGFSLDQYIYFGGYPGAATLIHNEERWKDYIRDSLVETSIAEDILLRKIRFEHYPKTRFKT